MATSLVNQKEALPGTGSTKNTDQMGFLDVIHVQISQVVDLKLSVSDKTGMTGYVTHTKLPSDRKAATLSARFSDLKAFWLNCVG